MGQYYKAVSFKGIEKEKRTDICIFSPFNYDTGMKLMEHSYFNNWLVTAVLLDISTEPKIVAWVGDYTNEDLDLPGNDIFPYLWGNDDKVSLYEKYEKKDAKMVEKALKEHSRLFNSGFLINYDEGEYVDIEKYLQINPATDGWMVHPLPLLTATSNGRGGGDYHESNPCSERVGSWALTKIAFSPCRPPKGYTDITEEVLFVDQ